MTNVGQADRDRVAHEIAHGGYLLSVSAERAWGWGTPAGQLRARRRAALILEGAGVGPTGRVLEIGCGTGLFTEMFARSGAEIVALDVSAGLLALAQKRNLARVTFVEGSFENSVLEGPFDAIVGSSVLHHLDLLRTWPKIYSLLKPGGRMSFAEPNMLNPQVFCERHFRSFFPQVSPDETAFVRFGLKRSLEEAGFEAISVMPFDWLHPGTPKFFIPVVSRLGQLLEAIPALCEFAGSLCIRAVRAA